MPARAGSSVLALTAEIFLGLFSFIFFKIARFLTGFAVRLHVKKHPEDATSWRILSEESLRMPIAVPLIMTTGPRWNPHALIGAAGPLHVVREFRIHVESARRSAKAWTIVVYSFPDSKTIATIGSLDHSPAGEWHSIPLSPGRYRLAARYYDWGQEVELPAVEADGIEIVLTRPVSCNANDCYEGLRGRGGFYYRCLHYYIYPLLRFRKYLSRKFVEREYLPIGNPETEFSYGILESGESLRMDLDARLRPAFNVYLTIYNRASFPIRWYPVTGCTHITDPTPEESFYLVRIHKTLPSGTDFEREWIRTETVAPDEIQN